MILFTMSLIEIAVSKVCIVIPLNSIYNRYRQAGTGYLILAAKSPMLLYIYLKLFAVSECTTVVF